MPLRSCPTIALVAWITCSPLGLLAGETFRIEPSEVVFTENFAQIQLVVTANGEPEISEDLTRKVAYSSLNEQVAIVTPEGQVLPCANGSTEIQVRFGDSEQKLKVSVANFNEDPVVSYLDHVRPALYKAGCNMGACHAAQHGQGGFKLSVFGFDPLADHLAIVKEGAGRRINQLDSRTSLILRKPTLELPHGGGRRLQVGSRDYEMIASWIRGGAKGPESERPISRLIVNPNQRIGQPGLTQQLQVNVVFSDGQSKDVTAWAKFDSMDAGVVSVDSAGYCTVSGRGQAPVMVRYEGQAEIAMFVIPYGPPAQLVGWKSRNFIDDCAAKKFQELGIEPSPLCDDVTFLRRVFLDITGTLPTRDEVEEFLVAVKDAPNNADIRTEWIKRLLGLADSPRSGLYNERYAAYWTLKWSDLIRNNSRDLQETGMWALHNWIKGAFRENRTFDRFVSELVQGKGSNFSNGPANYFIVNGTPQVLAESTSQLFLGTRLTCAQCHHHPFEKYSQDDYYGFAAYFARTGLKSSQEFGMFGGERVVMIRTGGEVHQPRTGKPMQPKPLDAQPVDHPLDRRIALAEWMTSPKNPAFARATVNRYLNSLLGRGLVEPVDDLRATNPPTNLQLMQSLSDDFVTKGFDLKQLVLTITSSRLYQLDSQPTSQNLADSRFYSHFEVKRLSAEPLLDAIDHAAGTQTKFNKLPLGTRAIEIPDAEYPDYFLNTFAKPRRTSVCECERSPDANLAQALHTLNGDILAAKISAPAGRIAKLLEQKKSQTEIITDLYFATLCRAPSTEEMAAADKLVAESASPKECYEDLLWALLNSKSFLFVR